MKRVGECEPQGREMLENLTGKATRGPLGFFRSTRRTCLQPFHQPPSQARSLSPRASSCSRHELCFPLEVYLHLELTVSHREQPLVFQSCHSSDPFFCGVNETLSAERVKEEVFIHYSGVCMGLFVNNCVASLSSYPLPVNTPL